MIRRLAWVGAVTLIGASVGAACGGDDDTGEGGGTTTAGTTATGTGGGTTATGTGGGTTATGAGGGATGGSGAGGEEPCVYCAGASDDPLGNFGGTFCDAEADTLYDALVDCACTACPTDCAGTWVCVDGGTEPETACDTCYEAAYAADCSDEASACLADES